MSRAFTEIRHVQQTPGEPHKRWFQSDYFDLFVWHEADGTLWGFRLCYDRCFDEHAITWRRETDRVTHHFVDQGERGDTSAGTPLLREAQPGIPAEVVVRFEAEADPLPDELRVLIRRVLVANAAS